MMDLMSLGCRNSLIIEIGFGNQAREWVAEPVLARKSIQINSIAIDFNGNWVPQPGCVCVLPNRVATVAIGTFA